MKQELFDESTIGGYLDNYATTVRAALRDVSWPKLEQAYRAMIVAERIFVCGNGGSAAIANHLETDFSKAGIKKVHSLCANPSLITMIGNDFGFDHVFMEQLLFHRANSNDLLILISSSGRSPNITKAMLASSCITLGLSGFDGGDLAKTAGISLHVPANNYGVVEDCHQTIMHVLTQWYIKDHSGQS